MNCGPSENEIPTIGLGFPSTVKAVRMYLYKKARKITHLKSLIEAAILATSEQPASEQQLRRGNQLPPRPNSYDITHRCSRRYKIYRFTV